MVQMVPLHPGHLHIPEQLQCLLVLYAFGNDMPVQRLPDIIDGPNHSAVGFVTGDIAHETAVDFQVIDR
jgi:hypothetical protein